MSMKLYSIIFLVAITCISCKTKEKTFSINKIDRVLEIEKKSFFENDDDFRIMLSFITFVPAITNVVSIEKNKKHVIVKSYKFGIKKNLVFGGTRKFKKTKKHKLSIEGQKLLLEQIISSNILNSENFCNDIPCDKTILDGLIIEFRVFKIDSQTNCSCKYGCDCSEVAIELANILSRFMGATGLKIKDLIFL